MPNHQTWRYFRSTAAMLLVAGVAACGGGGDSGGGGSNSGVLTAPTTPVAVTTTNADAAATAAVSSAATVGSSGGLLGAQVGTTPVPPRKLSRITSDAVKRVQTAQMSQSVTGATNTYQCATGNGTYTVTSDQTSFSITFSNCSDYAGEVVNGSLSVIGMTGTQTSFSGTFSADLTITETNAPTVRMVGGFTLTLAFNNLDYTATLSGTSFALQVGTEVHVLSNFNVSENYVSASDVYSSSGGYTLASTAIGGSVTVSVLPQTPVQQYGTHVYPFAGQIVVTGQTPQGGTGPSAVRVTIQGDEITLATNQVKIEVDANGDGVYDAPYYKNWSQMPI